MALTIDLEAGLRPPPAPERGTPDGRLVFRRELGQGAEGKVYVAVPTRGRQQQQLLGPTSSACSGDVTRSCPKRRQRSREVAVKVMAGSAYERCRATRSLWPCLVHPNIVFPRKDFFDHANGRCFVEMELCETDLLDMVIQGGALRDSRVSIYAGQLASALDHLHGQGIAHRDVKLENVFVREGTAKLGDLGSIAQIPPPNTTVPASCQHDRHERNEADDSIRIRTAAAAAPSSSKTTCSFVGSAMYAPPEAVRRSTGDGARTAGRSSASSSTSFSRPATSFSRHDPFAGDIWALGVTLWSAKARSHPWEVACVDRSKEFRRFVRKGAEAAFPESFSPGLRALLSRLLSLDPLQRPTASEILATQWVTAPPPPTPTPLPTRTQKMQQQMPQAPQHGTQKMPLQEMPGAKAVPRTPLSPEGGGACVGQQTASWSTCAASSGRGQPAPVTPTGPESAGLDAGRFDQGYSRAGVVSPNYKVGEVRGETEAGVRAGCIDSSPDINASPIPVKIDHHHNQNHNHHNYDSNHHHHYRHGDVLVAVTAPVVARGEKRRSSAPTVEACEDGFDASPPAIEAFSPEMKAFSPVMNTLGGILDVRSGGNTGSGSGEGGRIISRVTPSPLTLPKAAGSVEVVEERGGQGAVTRRENMLDFVEAPQTGATRVLKRPVPACGSNCCSGMEKGAELLQQTLQRQQQQLLLHEMAEREGNPRPCKKAKSRHDDGVAAAAMTGTSACATISFTLGERGE